MTEEKMTVNERLDRATIRLVKKMMKYYEEKEENPIKLLDSLDRDEAFIYGVVSATVMLRDGFDFPENVVAFFNWCYSKIKQGKSEDEIIEEIKKIRKEVKLRDYMMYGSFVAE